MNLLLKDSTKVGIRGISCEGDRSSGVRMEENRGRGQNFLDAVNSSPHGR